MKHLLLSASLLLFASNLTAQLHVSPSATADSYIYANDVVIYVEQDINLVNNVNPETQASIYLRGDSQLIQGDKPLGSTNSGTGSISILQRGWANAFDYNYWASPVGVPEGEAGNRNFGIKRFFDVQGGGTHPTHSIQQISTPALNGQSNPLRISSRWIYTLRNTNEYAEWAYIANASNLVAGEGFTMKGTRTAPDAHDQLYDFRGRPNDGDISIDVAHNGTDGLSRLVGNPYPSALDLADFLQENNDIRAQILYWDQDRTTNTHYISGYEGGYGTWLPTGGDDIGDGTSSGTYVVPLFTSHDGYGIPGEVTGGIGGHLERRFAPVGQGFVVVGDNSISGAGTGTITFKNSMRRHVGLGAGNFSQFKSGASNKDNNELKSLTTTIDGTLRLHVEVNSLYTRDMVLMFSDQSTNGYDRGMDATHPSVLQSGDAYWRLEGEKKPYVIQTRPYDFHSKVPIGFRVKNGQNSFKVNLVEMKGFDNFNNFRLFLYDELNNTYQRLNLGEQALVNHSGSAGQIENRYYLVFKRGQGNSGHNGNGNKSLAVVDFFQNNPQSKLEVSNPDVLDIRNASIYDMRGRLVLTENNIGKVAKFSFPTGNLSTGVYIVKLSTTENGIIDYKITVHNR